MDSLRIRAVLALLAVLSASVFAAQETIIQSVAGGGNLNGYTPNKAAISVNGTSGMVLNPITKELYFSDTIHHQIYKVNSTTGLIELVAGNGTESFSGDGAVAVSAGLKTPGALAFNAAGTLLYISDNGNFRIRVVNLATALISTFAGVGVATGTGTPPAVAGDGGLATAASFNGNVNGLAVAADGAVLISDSSAHYVRRVTVDGNIAPFAGTSGNAGNGGDGAAATAGTLNNPRGLVFDDAGNLYIATQGGGGRVRKVDTAGLISTLSGLNAVVVPDANGDGGNADVAVLTAPAALAYDKTKKILYVGTPNGAGQIRSINLGVTPPTITSLTGAGGTTDAGPIGANTITAAALAVDDLSNVYVLDSANSSIRRIDIATGFVDTVLGLTTSIGLIGDRSPGFTPIFEIPSGVALDDAGNLYIADSNASTVRRIKADGSVDTIAGSGKPGFTGDGGPGFQATLNTPLDIEVIGTNLYIADSGPGSNVIRVVDLTTGLIKTLTNATTGTVRSLAKDASGVLVVAANNVVQKVAADGTVTNFAGQTPAGANAGVLDNYVGAAANAEFRNLKGIAVGPNGDIYTVETFDGGGNVGNTLVMGSSRVRKFSADGTTTTLVAGTLTATGFAGDGGDALLGRFASAVGIAVTSNGNLIVTDTVNNRLRLINTSVTPNIISTAAGDGTAGLSGDGGLATLARVNAPSEIIDVGGVVFFVDAGNNRIRTLTNATILDPKLIALGVKLSFAKDKKTGLQIRGKDSVQLKAGLLPLPAGITPANLVMRVDIVELHDQIQLDASGKQPKVAKPAKLSKTNPLFNYTQFNNTSSLGAKWSLGLKAATTGTETKPVSFAYSAKGTFSDDLGRVGFVNKTTTGKAEQITGIRVNITLDSAGAAPATFTGVITADYKASLDKSGAAKSVKVK